MKISNPLPNAKISSPLFSKTIEFSSYNSDVIHNPSEGVVVSSDKFKCNGNIKIAHTINGNTYFSNFCNVNRIMSFIGDKVRQGDIIGTVGDSPIEYSVTDKSNDKIDANKFLSGNISTSITKEKDVEKKKEKETETKSTYKTGKTRNPFIDLISLPFSVVGKAFFKENIINDNPIIKEEINKIKKLINH
jgi:hypothetical protein